MYLDRIYEICDILKSRLNKNPTNWRH